jgi:hypothetical protein
MERAPGTHWRGGWVGPRAVLDAVVKRKIPILHWELNPRTLIIQPMGFVFIIDYMKNEESLYNSYHFTGMLLLLVQVVLLS